MNVERCVMIKTTKVLTLDGFQFICRAHENDPEAIGKYILEILTRTQNKER